MKYLSLWVLLIVVNLSTSLFAKKKDGPWPPFQVGVTGIMARPEKDDILPVTVAEITPGTPAAGKLEVGDVILAVNGMKLTLPNRGRLWGMPLRRLKLLMVVCFSK